MQQLFYVLKEKKYYLVIKDPDLDLKCTTCGKIIPLGDTVVIQRSFNKATRQTLYHCVHCLKKHPNRSYDEYTTAMVTTFIPDHATIVPDFSPGLSNANTDVFAAAVSNQGIGATTHGVVTIDKTKVAKDPFRNQMPDHSSKHKQLINKRIKELDQKIDTTKQASTLLTKIQSANPIPILLFVFMFLTLTGCTYVGSETARGFEPIETANHTLLFHPIDLFFMNQAYAIYKNEVGFCFNEINTTDNPFNFNNRSTFELTKTEIRLTNRTAIQFFCPIGTELYIHTHPRGICKFSDKDFTSLAKSKRTYTGIMCGKNNFLFINKSHALYEWEVI